jgi:signal transduction histidine kinase
MADSWDGWKLGWQHAFFGLPLAVQLARPDLLSAGSAGGLALRLALLVALVGWYAYWFGPWRARRSAILPYLIGAAALWLALVAVQPSFWIVGFAVLVPVVMRRPAWAAAGVTVCGTAWLAQRATATTVTWPEVVTSVLMVGAGIAGLGYVAALDREGRTRARLLDQLAAAQAELAAAERQRLAREVHDTLTQGFASIILLLEAMQESRDGANTILDRHLATALRTAQDNLAQSRRLVWALQPSPLDTAPLPDAVRQQTARLADDTGIAATTVVTGDPTPLEAPTEAGILRIVQEALTNARRHAHATTVTVTLSYEPDLVLVDIQDNGMGISADPPAGMGLRAMRQRAGELGGTVTIESDPGDGTTVALAVPTRTTAPLGARA